jgi:hypothetical protein
MKLDTKAFEAKMQKLVTGYESELETIRVGRANPKVLDKIKAAKAGSFSVADFYGDDLYTESMKLKKTLRFYATAFTPLTEYEIENMIRKGTEDKEDEDQYSKYDTAKGKLVAVTYGDQNAEGDYVAYKTFLLNYNNFSVRVEYNDVEYTIAPYGFVVVME